MAESVDIAIGRSTLQCANSDEALAQVLQHVLDNGHGVETYRPTQEKRRGSREVIDLQLVVQNPLDRILANNVRPLNIVSAVARFVWMLAGNDRLQDIAFYEPKVRRFTDNNLTVPGSNYGMRLFQPRPGINQIKGVVETLCGEVGSRRGAAVIWTPDDAVRASNDIPCAFGAFYHLRNGKLITTTVMRSNNAFILLPYNLFEFGLVGEMIAQTIRFELGPLIHFAASMHVFESELDDARKVIDDYRSRVASIVRSPMPQMPVDPLPFDQANALAQLEVGLRHDQHALEKGSLKEILKPAEDKLHQYWLEFYRVLLAHALKVVGRQELAREVAEQLPEYFRASVLWHVQPDTGPTGGKEQQQFFLGMDPNSLDEVARAFGPTIEEERKRVDQLDLVCQQIEKEQNRPILRSEFQQLRTNFVTEIPISIAARSNEGSTAGPDDRLALSEEQVRQTLERIRGSSPK